MGFPADMCADLKMNERKHRFRTNKPQYSTASEKKRKKKNCVLWLLDKPRE